MSRNIKKFIWVTFQRKGFHRFPEAATNPEYQDVAYLGTEHRHIFKFRISIEVLHTNREIEFHQFLNWLESLYDDKSLQLDYKSVEMLADELFDTIERKYPGRDITIEISEDGENGCYHIYERNN